MKKRWMFVSVLALVLLVLALTVGPGQAQGPEPPKGEAGNQPNEISAYISPVMSYQGRLIEDGSPADGTKSMTFRIYNAESDGTIQWQEGPKSVDVTNGLFSVTLGDTTAMDVNDFDQALWLEIEVEGTTLPRQQLMGAPYAYSLAPGADVSGDTTSDWSLLFVDNAGAGDAIIARSADGKGVMGDSNSDHGVYAESNGSGLGGAALYARSASASGIALWAYNDHNSSTDATIAVSNDGSGNLIKGFGGDGGEDEFRIHNDGTFESKADSYIFVPGNTFVKDQASDDTEWNCYANGSVRIWSSTGDSSRVIYIPITLPGVLYGRAVDVEKITIYYKCEDGTKSFITRTYLHKQTNADSSTTLVSNQTDRTSNTADDYTLDIDHTLSSDQGILGLYLYLDLDPGTSSNNYVQIGGVRIQLGHHHLY